ncbi:MAG: hypothetical protein JSW71_02470 [Gemmatimonadota bacterium]|nr:MAG: hypothetical protein JSW71_02470 [Gemmatimonadota bacterium]
MTLRRVLILASLIGASASWQPAHGQTPASLLEDGIRAYQELEFEAAAGFLRRALDPGLGQRLSDPAAARVLTIRALTYLAAAEMLGGNRDSARAAFERLVRFDTRYRPDQLIFPPQVTNEYDAVRRETKVITFDAPRNTRMRIGRDLFSFELFASSYHEAVVEIRDRDSVRVRSIYRGPIVDSLDLDWDGRDPERLVIASGPYDLWIQSRDSTGTLLRSLRVPLDIVVETPDTLIHPIEPADSMILPEQHSSGPGVQALAGGLLVGTAIAVLPTVFSSDTDLMGGRLLVAGTVSVAGIAAFFRRRPGKPIPENIASNQNLYRSYRDSLAVVVTENERRKTDIQLLITTGAVSAHEGPGR